MTIDMDDMALSEDTQAKAKCSLVGNVELLQDFILHWQRARDAKEPHVLAAANTEFKRTKTHARVGALLQTAIAAGFLVTGLTEGKLKEAPKRMESSGASSFSLGGSLFCHRPRLGFILPMKVKGLKLKINKQHKIQQGLHG